MIGDISYLQNIHRPLRLGIMCNRTNVEEWQFRVIQYLLALDFVELRLLIMDENARSKSLLSKMMQSLVKPKYAFFQFYYQFILRPRTGRQTDIRNLFHDIPSVYCSVIKERESSQCFTGADCNKISGFDLDLILKFGFGSIKGKILDVARYGIWSFRHDEEKHRGVPPCFWEIYNAEHVTEGILYRITDHPDGGLVLKKGFVATRGYSYSRNIEQLYYEIAKWPAQVCRDIYQGNAGYLDNRTFTRASINRTPHNIQMLAFANKVMKNWVCKAWQTLFYRDQWNIGVVCQPIDKFLQSEADSCQIHWAPTAANRFLADPFGKPDDANIKILCEYFDYNSGKGAISSIAFTGEGQFSEAVPVINEPFHMSYPYLLQHRGEIYCIPETFNAREVGLYKADLFPGKWRKVAVLVSDVAAVDPTVFQYEGLWWLMHTDEEQGSAVNLFAWYAPDLMGPWKPHQRNPVKTDVRSSRPAGNPFMHEGYLYRPAQDCSKTYGGRISLNRILRLTPRDFAEEFIRYIEPSRPGPFPAGLHTISAAGNFTLVDGKRYVFKPIGALNIPAYFKKYKV